ncbi:MAG: efflux RND transporter periplasmic adaptor subunit [Eubacteriales bacterium]|nr:efflux RND transporter periplasmic adaptor subunit [Eubacteriales bacterium]MDD3200136.1 efflux RND transporter periplasmic adaptor subunit [Eubacteriales bacterium]MDD4630403.1 efflux RND transporter periplasmic adaptor subunit [Eubacteriales bacterium]
MKEILKFGKKRKIAAAIVAVVLIAGIVIVKGMLVSSDAAMTEAAAIKQDLTKYYSFSGNIEPSDVQYVVATSNEPVKTFYVKEGDKVQVGDLLYEIDSNTMQSTMTTANMNLSNAKTNYSANKLDYERKKSLYEIGGVTLEELQSAQNALSSAQNQVTQTQANYQQAQKQYEDTRCYAEVSGEISKIYVDENDSINQGASIMDIVNYDNLEISIKIDEYDLSEVSEGMEAEVSIEAIGKTVIGTISAIARGASVENGVSYFDTTVTLPQDSDIRVGLSAEVKIITQSAKGAVTVPIMAVTYNGANAYVKRYDDSGSLENVQVIVGINNGTDIEIKNGLNEGDKIAYINTSSSDNSQMGAGPMGGPPQGGGAKGGLQGGRNSGSGAAQ